MDNALSLFFLSFPTQYLFSNELAKKYHPFHFFVSVFYFMKNVTFIMTNKTRFLIKQVFDKV